MKNTICLLILFIPVFLFSQNKNNKTQKITVDKVLKNKIKSDTLKIYTWYDETCEYKSVYNSNKYTEEQLKNTVSLINNVHHLLLQTSPTSFMDKDFEPDRNLNLLEEEYNKVRNGYSQMKIVDQPYWISLRDSLIKEIDEHYDLIKTTLQAQKNPQLFLKNKYTSACIKYAEALASDNPEKLMETWKEMKEERKEKNDSGNNLDYVRFDLLNFGWWNCANHQIHSISYPDDSDLNEKYKELFFDTKTIDCEEP